MPNTIKATKSNIKTLIGNVPIYLKCPITNIIDVVQRVKLKKTRNTPPPNKVHVPCIKSTQALFSRFL